MNAEAAGVGTSEFKLVLILTLIVLATGATYSAAEGFAFALDKSMVEQWGMIGGGLYVAGRNLLKLGAILKQPSGAPAPSAGAPPLPAPAGPPERKPGGGP